MKKGEQMNTVQPIRDEQKLYEIQAELEADETQHGQRMYLLFMTGIYTGLRISDIVRLKVGNVSGPEIVLIEQKTSKRTKIAINPQLRAVYAERLEGLNPKDYIFLSRRRRPDGTRKPITTRQAQYDCETIKKRFNIQTAFGCHSLRKTFGYWYYKANNGDLEGLRQIFNHATTDITRRYIGIDEEERSKRINKLNMGGFKPAHAAGRRPTAEAEPLEITRLDRSKNGRKYGQTMAAKAKKAHTAKKKKGE